MATKWQEIEIKGKLFKNVQESVLSSGSAAIENAFVNEAGGHSRFPGLKPFATLLGNKPTYLAKWRNELFAVSAGQFYTIDSSGNATNITGVPLSGDRRVIIDYTENELVAAAGGPIIRFAGDKTEVLSEDAPDTTHVAFVSGYLLALDGSGRFYHSDTNNYRVWFPQDVFTANSKPDNIDGLVVTPYEEVITAGIDSVEQFERLVSGTVPFFRRWTVGEGISAPYTLVAADNGVWGVNRELEFVRFSGQLNDSQSDDIGRKLESITNWEGAWATRIHIKGQKFILLQIPNEPNGYGTDGITLLLDYRVNYWYALYSWDDDKSQPVRWPGWSYFFQWNRHFVGGNGVIYELDNDTFQNDGSTQRVLFRTGHLDKWGESRIDNVRIRVKRGIVTSNDKEPVIALRVRQDNKSNWSRWKKHGLGLAGNRTMYVEFGGFGCGHTHQFEYMVTDNCDLEVVSMEAQLTPLGE